MIIAEVEIKRYLMEYHSFRKLSCWMLKPGNPDKISLTSGHLNNK